MFAVKLACEQRDPVEEIRLIEVTRQQMARILKTLSPDEFRRTRNHFEDGSLDLTTLLTPITDHRPHHIRFIKEKRAALGC
ncbi:MAG: hypothetical protein R3C59_21395 [Planctomycetaceae bacterium]